MVESSPYLIKSTFFKFVAVDGRPKEPGRCPRVLRGRNGRLKGDAGTNERQREGQKPAAVGQAVCERFGA